MIPEPSPEPIRDRQARAIDVSMANSARIWNYWLGGKDNYEIDRQVGDLIARGYPQVVSLARYTRAFLGRSVTFLAAEAGIRQFLDIGSGLPAADNVHEVASRAAPDCRVLYVDRDPMVLSHIRARLLVPADHLVNGIEADLTRPEQLLARVGEHLDLTEPVAVILSNVLGHVPGFDQARSVVRRLLWPLAPGSHLVLADATNVIDGPAIEAAVRLWNGAGSERYQLRTPAEIEQLFDGLELLDPGVVSCPLWRPQILTPDPVDELCGVARKR